MLWIALTLGTRKGCCQGHMLTPAGYNCRQASFMPLSPVLLSKAPLATLNYQRCVLPTPFHVLGLHIIVIPALPPPVSIADHFAGSSSSAQLGAGMLPPTLPANTAAQGEMPRYEGQLVSHIMQVWRAPPYGSRTGSLSSAMWQRSASDSSLPSIMGTWQNGSCVHIVLWHAAY